MDFNSVIGMFVSQGPVGGGLVAIAYVAWKIYGRNETLQDARVNEAIQLHAKTTEVISNNTASYDRHAELLKQLIGEMQRR